VHSYRLPLYLAICCSLLLSLSSLVVARPAADSAILFIGDGMGPGQVEMTAGADGRALAMQRMPYSGVVATTSIHGDVTDSAAAATALATGYKTENGMIAMSPEGRSLRTILEECQARGKSVGVITTDSLWGATPAGFAAHASSRGQYAEIAEQMAGSRAQVMLGYWKDEFEPKAAGGKREDGKDLLASLRKAGYAIVATRQELAAAKQPKLVGTFDDGPDAPTVADMVQAALVRLQTNPKGFFLVVEQARIDWEPGDPSAVIADVNQLDEAAAAAEEFARSHGDTLVVVTADHETGGLVIDDPAKLPALAKAKGRAGGIASHLNADRSNITQVMADFGGVSDLTPHEAAQIKDAKEVEGAVGAVLSARAGVKWTSDGDHTARRVRIFAYGSGAERFTGELKNTDVPARIAAALGFKFPR
jgi:alkaline phosphatase